jgi:hypothetical protein
MVTNVTPRESLSMSDPKDDLIALAAAMRAAQKRYFAGRSSVDRDNAITLERRWDREYRRYQELGGQLELFGREVEETPS